MTPINLALEIEQEQRISNDLAAFEHKIDADNFVLLKTEAKLDGLRGYPPKQPNSPIYWQEYCIGLQVYWIQQQEADFNGNWEECF